MHMVDRRPNPGSKSLENRQRFLRRAKARVQGAVEKSSQDRDIRDILEAARSASRSSARKYSSSRTRTRQQRKQSDRGPWIIAASVELSRDPQADVNWAFALFIHAAKPPPKGEEIGTF
jgi:Protein of unknown function (DUF444)